jgi:hypothetical protein
MAITNPQAAGYGFGDEIAPDMGDTMLSGGQVTGGGELNFFTYVLGLVDPANAVLTISQADAFAGPVSAAVTTDPSGEYSRLSALLPAGQSAAFVAGPVQITARFSIGGIAQTLTVAGNLETPGQALPYLPLLSPEDVIDYSVPLTIYQGSRRHVLQWILPDSLTDGLTAAKVGVSPRFGDTLLSLPTIAGQAMTPAKALQYAFPAFWGDNHLPAGDWLLFALLTYSDGASETVPLGQVVRVLTAPNVVVIASASAGYGFGDEIAPDMGDTMLSGQGVSP